MNLSPVDIFALFRAFQGRAARPARLAGAPAPQVHRVVEGFCAASAANQRSERATPRTNVIQVEPRHWTI